MGSIPAELSLDLRPTYVPKSISDFLKEISPIGDVSQKAEKLGDFIKRLEDEMRKIEAFKRELPLCMLLLKDAIQFLKEEPMQCTASNAQPVLEEFIPLKTDQIEDSGINKENDCVRDKMNWMSSVQLWKTDEYGTTDSNQKPDSAKQIKQACSQRNEKENRPTSDDLSQSCKTLAGGRAFMPFKGYPSLPTVAERKQAKEDLPVSGLSLLTPGTKTPRGESGSSGLSSKSGCTRAISSSVPNSRSDLQSLSHPVPAQQQASRKQRRCWSPELHRRFVNALQQLGGSQVATPKQIRELMQVDGLTNDEVKSHLQKYRLHTRRLPTAASSIPANQPVVLGGLWMPQDQYGDSSKLSHSQSGSPQGPLQLTGNTGGTSTTGSDSMEDEEDEKSESYSWKSRIHKHG